jgi:hypothetical protein
MVTIKEEPKLILKKAGNAVGTDFENHEFFEASSIRKIKNKYYLIYSSIHNHELCYATSNSPIGGFTYGGTIISNGDLFLNNLSDEKRANNYIGNIHGSIVELKGQWYVFYHRHTNRHSFSRQACAEPITIEEDGSIKQVEMTSCGLNGEPLIGTGRYEAYIACNLMTINGTGRYDKLFCRSTLSKHPYFTQDGKDRDNNPNQYIANFRSGSIAGFKYFDMKDVKKISIEIRSEAIGQVRVTHSLKSNESVAWIDITPCHEVSKFEAAASIQNGKQALFFHFYGKGRFDFLAFELKG